MLFNNDKKSKEEILQESNELENYRNSYSKKIVLYNLYKDNINIFKNELNKEELETKIRIFQNQINLINYNLELTQNWIKDSNKKKYIKIDKEILDNYTQDYEEIKNNYISNSINEEEITTNYIDGVMNELAVISEKKKEKSIFKIDIDEIIKDINANIASTNSTLINNGNIDDTSMNTIQTNDIDIKNNNIFKNDDNSNDISMNDVKMIDNAEDDFKLKNNDTLLISENSGKVILPYTAKEVLEIFNNEENEYKSVEDVIEEVFTRDLSDYKVQFISRYKETMKLAREKENYGLIDSITIATEMMKIRFLHPAIISACRSIDELDVYLDCLEKNELEDFKIFNIKYELYPILAKQSNKKIISKNISENDYDNINNNIDKNKRKRGKRYINNSKHLMWSNFKNKSKKRKTAIDEII